MDNLNVKHIKLFSEIVGILRILYNLQIDQKVEPTSTYIFGTKLLLTLGVEILGEKLDSKIFTPFKTIEEIIELKDNMRPLQNSLLLLLI